MFTGCPGNQNNWAVFSKLAGGWAAVRLPVLVSVYTRCFWVVNKPGASQSQLHTKTKWEEAGRKSPLVGSGYIRQEYSARPALVDHGPSNVLQEFPGPAQTNRNKPGVNKQGPKGTHVTGLPHGFGGGVGWVQADFMEIWGPREQQGLTPWELRGWVAWHRVDFRETGALQSSATWPDGA